MIQSMFYLSLDVCNTTRDGRRNHSDSTYRVDGRRVLPFLLLVSCIHLVCAFSNGASPTARLGVHKIQQNFRYQPSRACSILWSSRRDYSLQNVSPIPTMPSQLFQQLALSQLELLAASLRCPARPNASKVRSMALYLPQENANTGQLEFLPAVIYPNPSTERVFIASSVNSGVAPTLPRTLTTLPGFAHATSLLPGYPMVSSGRDAGVGVVEEVLCDISSSGGAALSVPLFAGSQTVGVLLVSPAVSPRCDESVWTKEDREQVARAAKSLSLALSMDKERTELRAQTEQVQKALSDSLHQVKNPLQALRTYGKLLQRRIADTDEGASVTLLELAEHLMVQSDRLAERLKPVDLIIESLGTKSRKALNPAKETGVQNALVKWVTPLPWEEETMQFARDTQTSDIKSPTNFTGSNQLFPQRATPEFRMEKRNKRDSILTTSSAFLTSTTMNELDCEMSFIGDVLEPIFSGFRAIAVDYGISFSVEESDEVPGIMICPQALQEAVSNVLDNSFKYVLLPKTNVNRNRKPEVRVVIYPNEKPKLSGVTILVEDNGIGIPPHERDRVFERGVRGDATKSIEGSGIGLDIARSLVEGMGGQIGAVDSKILDGAAVEIVLFRRRR